MKAVVPAAGRGTRLGALTRETPKALVPVAGAPVLRRVLRSLSPHVDGVVVVVGWLGDLVRAAVPTWGLEVEVDFVVQEEPRGTADAVLRARPVVGEEAFVYAWGDVLTPSGLVGEVLAAGGEDDGVIAVDRVDDVSAGADVRIHDGRVTSIVEKPSEPAAGWNAAGVGRLPADAWDLLASVTPSPRGETELTDVLASLARAGRLAAVPARGPVFDVGTPERLSAAEAHLRGPGS